MLEIIELYRLQYIKDNARAKNVSLAIIALLVQDFGRHISGRAAFHVEHSLFRGRGQAEIYNLEGVDGIIPIQY